MSHRILVIDDDAGFLDSIKSLLEATGMIVTTRSKTIGLPQLLKVQTFDCALIDYNLGSVLGTEVIAEIRACGVYFPCIVITAFGNVAAAVESLKMGAVDFVEKPFEPADLIALITKTIALSGQGADIHEMTTSAKKQLLTLSYRERQIVDSIVAGQTSKEIARDFGLSQRTVEAHRANILAKLNLANTASLVRLAVLSSLQPKVPA